MNIDKDYIEKNFDLNVIHKQIALCEKQINSINTNTFNDLASLEYLWLSSNQIKVLNENVFIHLVDLKHLALDDNQIYEFKSAFVGLEKLEHLELSSNEIIDFDGTNTFKCLKSLKQLKLASNKILSLNTNMFCGLESLICLDLNSNMINDLGQNIFKNLNSLRFLSLAFNFIKKINANAFNCLVNLEQLDLNNNKINKIDENAFNGLKTLKTLNLSNNKITELKSNSFDGLFNLKDLKLTNNKIVAINAKAFYGLLSLKTLCLYMNKVIILKTNAFESLEQLIKLNISNNSICELEVNVFQPLKKLNRLHLYSNKITELKRNAFNGMECLTELVLNENQIVTVDEESFDGLVALKKLQAQNNQIKWLKSKSFVGLTNLNELHLNNNQIEKIDENAFNGLVNLRKLILSSNKISLLGQKTFANLVKLEELEMESNQIACLNERLFTNLNLICLYLHPINFKLKPKMFTNMSNRSISLINLTLFDEFILYKPNFKTNKNPIMPENLSMYFGKRFTNSKFNTDIFLSSNSLVSFKLNNKKYKSIQCDFKWRDISRKLSVITGLNGVGKTTLLKLINESLSIEETKELTDYCVVKYSNTAENDFTFNQTEINTFNKKLNDNINDFHFDIQSYWSHFLYDNINYFSLIQYFDYLVSINNQFEEFSLINEKLLKYKFNQKRILQRKKQQDKFNKTFQEARKQLKINNKSEKLSKNINLDYYSEIRPIEFYLGLNEDHKLSSGESLILMLELWRLHAKQLKKENQSRPFRTKLRIILLDEPDSHMHPSLIKEFISLLTNNDLDYLKFQVVMTTHSPVSVSFVPLENVFEMKRDQQTGHVMVNKIAKKSEIIKSISEDLVFIKEKFKIVFIEGARGEDEAFYSFVNSIIKREISVPIKFQEMGNTDFNQIFINNSSHDPSHKLDEFIFGINDGDYNITKAYRFFGLKEKYFMKKNEMNNFQANFRRLERYSFENYVFDPINFCFAVSYLIKKRIITLKKESESNSFLKKVLDFLQTINSYANINELIRVDRERAKLLFNQLIRDTADLYSKNIDKNHSFFETFELKQFSNDELDLRINKPIVVNFILDDDTKFNLNYFPLLLYFPGKKLKNLLFKELEIIAKTVEGLKIINLIKIFKEESGFLCDKSLYDILETI